MPRGRHWRILAAISRAFIGPLIISSYHLKPGSVVWVWGIRHFRIINKEKMPMRTSVNQESCLRRVGEEDNRGEREEKIQLSRLRLFVDFIICMLVGRVMFLRLTPRVDSVGACQIENEMCYLGR